MTRLLLFHLILMIATSIGNRPVRAAGDLVFSGLALSPQTRVVPGGVLILYATAANQGDEVAGGTIVANIEGFPGVQSARRISLEPGQREQFELYIQLPHSIAGMKALEIVATMHVRYGNRDVILDRRGAPASYSMTLTVDLDQVLALVMEAEPAQLPAWYWPQRGPYTSYEMAIAARVDSGNARVSAIFEARPLPLNSSDWEAIELLVVAEKRTFGDAAAVEAMRRFLAEGGRIWVMLDRVPCELVRPLLGTNQICEAVDQVELNDFTVEVAGLGLPLSKEDRSLSLDEAIVMTRVMQSGGTVTHQVNSWPAAIAMDVGYGQLLLTTLDSSGWIEPRQIQRSDDPRYRSDYQLWIWGKPFAMDANAGRGVRPLSVEVDYPLSHIGNPIVPRGWVAIALLAYCGLLGSIGLWRASVGERGSIGVIAPLIAVACSAPLLLASTWIRRDIPESVSRLQVIEVGDDGSFALAREQAAVYLDATASMQLEAEHDGRATVHESMSSGIHRFMVDDFQHWSLGNSHWPPGSWRYETEFAVATTGLSVVARLTNQGIHLDLPPGLPSPLEDPVLGFVVGDPMLCDATDDGFHADGSVTIDGERWIAGSIMSDEQQRRLQIYQEYFRPDDGLNQPARRLYGWTEPWGGSRWNRELMQLGSALVALPVRLERPIAGAEVFVPHGLIQLRRDVESPAKTSVFSDKTAKWVKESAMAVQAELEFVLPPEVVPFAAEAIELALDIKAPHRVVTLAVPMPSGDRELIRLESPSVPWHTTISEPAILNEVRDGVLDIVLTISELTGTGNGASAPTSVVTWQIEHFHASMRGAASLASSLSR